METAKTTCKAKRLMETYGDFILSIDASECFIDTVPSQADSSNS
jgi:hypothetical protein